MDRYKLLVLVLCFSLTTTDPVGPESRKDSEKNEEDDVSSEVEETKGKPDSEYIKELTDAMNKEILTLQEYADAMKSQSSKDETNKGLEVPV